MPKFNEIQKSTRKATSYEGGQVYTKGLEDEWVNMLFSCMLNDAYYESSEDVQTRYIDLTKRMIDKHGAKFVGKAAHFSRNVLGMRSISELTAAILNDVQFDGKRQFFAKYFHRPDDIGEVFGAVDSLCGKRSHALIRGAKDYLEKLDAYHVAKYPMNKRQYNMHDIINLTHAKSDVLDKYQKGILESPDTWEVRISTASEENRESEWKRLVEQKKLGYLALIRNLRNIFKCSFATDLWSREHLIPQILNKDAIEKSLVFPYQIYVAWSSAAENGLLPMSVELALSDAFMLATDNMPMLEGDSLIVIDVSGSMQCKFGGPRSTVTISEASAVYAAALLMANRVGNVDIIKFGTNFERFDSYKRYGNVFKLIKAMQDNSGLGYGTEITPVFRKLKKHYERIFLFSDMQVMGCFWSMNGEVSSQEAFRKYEEDYGNTTLYSFDLGNYHTQLVSPSERIVYITALTDLVFKAISMMEDEGKSLIDVIREYDA